MGRTLSLSVVVLTLLGVGSAISRGLFPADAMARAEPGRRGVMRVFGVHDPLEPQRQSEVSRFDGRFGTHLRATRAHVVSGALFLLLAPLQFSERIRERFPQVHRACGRLLLLSGVVAASTGLYFGVGMPYSGAPEAVTIVVFGGLFLVALARAYVAIRARDAARHREWMIRAFAVAIGVSTVRLVGALFDLGLTPFGVHPRDVFVLSLWTGWGITVAAAELWIRRDRPLYGLRLSSR